jgi:hypothetical protein
MGRHAGVGEGRRCGGARRGRRWRSGQRKLRRRLRRGPWLHGNQQLHGRPPVFAAALALLPRYSFPLPPPPSPPACRWCGQGNAPLGRLGLGAPEGCGGGYLLRRTTRGTWTARMRGTARDRIATAPPARRGGARPTGVTKGERGG